MCTDYERAKSKGSTDIQRWEKGIEHHPESERLMSFLMDHDFNDYEDHFCWKKGGDGDNGETLMFQMDPFFEGQHDVRDELIAKLESYATFLGKGLLVGAICGGGCSDDDFEKGKQFRADIEKLKAQI